MHRCMLPGTMLALRPHYIILLLVKIMCFLRRLVWRMNWRILFVGGGVLYSSNERVLLGVSTVNRNNNWKSSFVGMVQ